jgi:hypothetical protein
MLAASRSAYSALSAAHCSGVRALLLVHSLSLLTLLLFEPGMLRPTNTMLP